MRCAVATTRVLSEPDQGTSLIELIVGMLIMTMFMAMFTSAVILMNRAENKADAVTQTSTQLNQAFLTLDKTVRYAAAISDPGVGTPSGDWYVELRTTNTGSEVCTQYRVHVATQQLQQRTWNVSVDGDPSNLTSWAGLASGISNGAVQPFVPVDANDNVGFQQLTVSLVSLPGSASTSSKTKTSFTFTALNSTATPPASVCQEEGRP